MNYNAALLMTASLSTMMLLLVSHVNHFLELAVQLNHSLLDKKFGLFKTYLNLRTKGRSDRLQGLGYMPVPVRVTFTTATTVQFSGLK